MRKLLRLDASAQSAASHSRKLADHYEARWRDRYSNGMVVVRDLASDPVPHLDEATVAVFYAGGDPGDGPVPSGIALSDELIRELQEADDLVISSAVYNFGMPSSLKAWIDHIVRFGATVAYGENGPVGLLSGKRVCLLTARGGATGSSPDFQFPLLEAVFAYVGIPKIHWISLAGTRTMDGELEARIDQAWAAIDSYIGRP